MAATGENHSMIIVDKELRKLEEQQIPIKVGLVGAGAMAEGLVNLMVNSVPGMRLAAISNRTVEKAVDCYNKAGIEQVQEAETCSAIEEAVADNRRVVTSDFNLLCEADGIDVVIDLTGAVEFGAGLALKSFDCGKHLVSMNAELDSMLGSVLQKKAGKAGVVYTLSDGDQPGVEMNLWRFVKGIGVEPLVCGNIKGLQDEYRTPTTQAGFAEQWKQNVNMVTSFADGTKISMEQACVANATGMQVEMRGMRGGDFTGHVDELCQNGRYDVDRLRELGGVVDYVVKARPSPGVFVVGTTSDPMHQRYLKLYKLGDGPLYSFYAPYHLCYFELPFSIARTVLFQDAVLQAQRPMVDVICMAKRDLKAGEALDGLGGYTHYGQCENYPVVRSEGLLLQGLAEGCVLVRDIPKDAAIKLDDVVLPDERLSDRLRKEQDQLFPV